MRKRDGERYHKVSQLVIFIVHILSSESESKNIESDGLNDIRRSRDENEDEKEDIEEEEGMIIEGSPTTFRSITKNIS